MVGTMNESTAQHELNTVMEERRRKLAALREQGIAYPNDFERLHYAAKLAEAYE